MKKKPALFDTHANLVPDSGEGADRSVIVEVTPRLRKRHPTWKASTLNGYAGKRVRVVGWVTLDNEHTNMITAGDLAFLEPWEGAYDT